jgi:hypothetical protein
MPPKKKKKKTKKPKMARDWNAVSAHFRSSKGAMTDKKKKSEKSKCRTFKSKRAEE